MPVSHGKPQLFIADRPPPADAIPRNKIQDIQQHVERGSGHVLPRECYYSGGVYFSHIINFPFTHSLHSPPRAMKAKIIAKMGRLIEIKDELQQLKLGGEKSTNYSDADGSAIEEEKSAATKISLPSDEEVERLLDNLQQSSVEI